MKGQYELKQAARAILAGIGEDAYRDGLRETPDRMVRAWKEMFDGYDKDPSAILKRFNNQMRCEEADVQKYDEMVVLKDIEFFSTCEHHFLPFFGHCHVAYIPGEYVFGISKLARLVECYAHRLQIQERLTQQIADALDSNGAVGVGVVLEAQHLCMMARGIKKQHSIMKTSALRGALKDKPEARAEFLKLIGGD